MLYSLTLTKLKRIASLEKKNPKKLGFTECMIYKMNVALMLTPINKKLTFEHFKIFNEEELTFIYYIIKTMSSLSPSHFLFVCICRPSRSMC